MDRFLWICLAGGLGSGARYLLGLAVGARWGVAFPYGTLLVNVVGCFLIAVITHVALRVGEVSPTLRLALTTGFLGGLTTYSTFNHDTLRMLDEGRVRGALVYFGVTTGGCLLAGVLGLALARRLVGP